MAFPSCSMPSQPMRGVRASSRRPVSAACFARAALAPLAMASLWHTTRPIGRSRSAPTRNHSETAFSAVDLVHGEAAGDLLDEPAFPPDRGRARGLPSDQHDERPGPDEPQRLARLDLADPFLAGRHPRDQRLRVLAPQLLDPVRNPVQEDDGDTGPGQTLERGPRPLPSGQHHEHPVGPRLAQVPVHRLDLGPRGAPGELGLDELHSASLGRGAGVAHEELLVPVVGIVEQERDSLGHRCLLGHKVPFSNAAAPARQGRPPVV
jgi:hypothetical protein